MATDGLNIDGLPSLPLQTDSCTRTAPLFGHVSHQHIQWLREIIPVKWRHFTVKASEAVDTAFIRIFSLKFMNYTEQIYETNVKSVY